MSIGRECPAEGISVMQNENLNLCMKFQNILKSDAVELLTSVCISI